MKIFRKNNVVEIDDDSAGTKIFITPPYAQIRKFGDIYTVHDSQKLARHLIGTWDIIEDENGDTFATEQDLIDYLTTIVNFNNGSGSGIISGTVDTYAELPTATEHTGEFWLVTQASGGYLSFLGIYKYPKGIYSPNTSEVWELIPLNVKAAEDSLTLVNITNWTEFIAYSFDISLGDRLIYNDIVYKNLTGTMNSNNPKTDTTNWIETDLLFPLDETASAYTLQDNDDKFGVIILAQLTIPTGLTVGKNYLVYNDDFEASSIVTTGLTVKGNNGKTNISAEGIITIWVYAADSVVIKGDLE